MTKSKHTPGPWEEGENWGCICESGTQHRIAIVEWIDSEEETSSNQSLITAAPALLAALEKVSEILDNGDPAITDTILATDSETLLDHCRAAIARAKGEA